MFTGSGLTEPFLKNIVSTGLFCRIFKGLTVKFERVQGWSGGEIDAIMKG